MHVQQHTSDETCVPTKQHSTKRCHGGEQVGSTIRLDVGPHLGHVELRHDGNVDQMSQRRCTGECDVMRHDERSKSVMSINQTLRQTSEYISSVYPTLQSLVSEPRPKPAGKRRPVALAVGIVQRDVGDMTWGFVRGDSRRASYRRRAP